MIFCQFQPGVTYKSVAYKKEKKTCSVYTDEDFYKVILFSSNKLLKFFYVQAVINRIRKWKSSRLAHLLPTLEGSANVSKVNQSKCFGRKTKETVLSECLIKVNCAPSFYVLIISCVKPYSSQKNYFNLIFLV